MKNDMNRGNVWSCEAGADSASEYLREIWAVVRTRMALLALWVGVCLALAFVYSHFKTPEFSASVRLLLRPQLIAVDRAEVDRQLHQIDLDFRQAETDLRLIRSEYLLRTVFDALRLETAPELQGSQNGFWSAVSTWAHNLAPDSLPQSQREHAFDQFRNRVRAMRLDVSYVLEISYRANKPAEASRVANAIASAYVLQRLAAAMTPDTASGKIVSRLDQVRGEMARASQAVQTGSVPETYLVDSGIRLLGAAVTPLSKAYPKFAPLALFAMSMGLISGLLVVIVQHMTYPSQRLQRRRLSELRIETIYIARERPILRLLDRMQPAREAWRPIFPQTSVVALEAVSSRCRAESAFHVVVIARDLRTSRFVAHALAGMIRRKFPTVAVSDYAAEAEGRIEPKNVQSAKILAALHQDIYYCNPQDVYARYSLALMVVEPYRTPLAEMTLVARIVRSANVMLLGCWLQAADEPIVSDA